MDENVIEVNNSILNTIKKMLGIDADNTDFDTDVIIHINTVFRTLNQLGIGPNNGYKIYGKENTWDEFIDDLRIEDVKTYMYIKVRLIFDPPQNSFLVNSFEKSAKEYEWRFTVTSDEIQNGGDNNG